MSNLIYTQSSGPEFTAFCEFTVPLMRNYADRIGASFIYDNIGARTEYPLFDKYKVYDLFRNFDRILFLDCDILVRYDSPDLFSLVPEGHFAALNEGSWLDNLDQLRARASYLYGAAEAFGYDAGQIDVSSRYFNAGVFLLDRKDREVLKRPEPHPFMKELISEQSLINLRLHALGVSTYSLPMCFNAMPKWWPTMYLEDNYFIHYAGMRHDHRFLQISKDHKVLVDRYGSFRHG
jgi:lipopolysaccharide biosynthesis glycosyltransferase